MSAEDSQDGGELEPLTGFRVASECWTEAALMSLLRVFPTSIASVSNETFRLPFFLENITILGELSGLGDHWFPLS
jgi:hypothetical protein